MLKNLEKDILRLENKGRAKLLSGFFKTGKGEYGEGDVFLGISVPEQRKVAIKYKDINLKDAEKLLINKIHEFRLIALLILVERFKKGDEKTKKEIADFYIKNANRVNNWDLVDLSAPRILGPWLMDKDKSILYKFAKSENIWERRISVLSTFYFISKSKFDDSLKISGILLKDKHDLIHKAVGWMLREIGKRNQPLEEEFLKKHYKHMPRTMLRYSIEKFDATKKKFYMS